MEQENEKVSIENKRLAVHAAKLSRKDSVSSLVDNQKNAELLKVRETLAKAEDEKSKLEVKLKTILETPVDKLPARVPKKYSDVNTKFQLQVNLKTIV